MREVPGDAGVDGTDRAGNHVVASLVAKRDHQVGRAGCRGGDGAGAVDLGRPSTEPDRYSRDINRGVARS